MYVIRIVHIISGEILLTAHDYNYGMHGMYIVCMYMCVCMYVCMYVYMHVCMYACIIMYVYMYVCVLSRVHNK